jgi:hypothetical protein
MVSEFCFKMQLVPLRLGRHGESAQHAASCGAGVGVFLLVKSTKILLVRGRRICLYPSVYLDAHGGPRVTRCIPKACNAPGSSKARRF